MRPYLAVIADSFHAALASRILWVAFLAIWLLLAALAPIGYREDYTTTFREWDFHNATQMKAMLARGLVDPTQQTTAVGRLAASLPDDLRANLERVGKGEEVRIRYSTFADALNEILDDESWFEAEAWKSTVRLRELRELDELGEQELSESLRRRRARLRIEAALPGVFESRSARSIVLTYAGFDFPFDLPAIDKTQFALILNQFVVPTIVDWILGFLLVLLGVLVTAHIIPDLLQPGSLHLLLSKPISRSGLFFSKVIGGCAFMFLGVVQLVVGLYLIAGARLDVWNVRMLWCIPVTVFMFAVYFSVSSVVGLRWRSPIVAIGITCVFGLVCFTVGLIGGLFDEFVTRPNAIRRMVVAGDTLIGSTRGGGLVRYDPTENHWAKIIEGRVMSRDRMLPPVAVDRDRVVTARVRMGRINPFGLGAADAMVLSRSNDWKTEPSLRLPAATSSLYAISTDRILAMNSSGMAVAATAELLAAAGEQEEQSPDENPPDQPAAEPQETGQPATDWLAKLSGMMGAATDGFESVLPAGVTVMTPRSLAIDREARFVILLSRGRLSRLAIADAGEEWSLEAEKSLDGEASSAGLVALSEDVLLVARKDQPLLFLRATDFEQIASVALDDSTDCILARGLGERCFLIATSDGMAHRIRVESSTAAVEPLSGLSEVETVAVDREAGLVYVCHHVDQLEVIDSKSLETKQRIRPALSGWRLVDRYAISPLRMVVPQTGELGETISSMVSGESAAIFAVGGEETETYRFNIVRPLVSCGTFIAMMMIIGCVYFSRRDF